MEALPDLPNIPSNWYTNIFGGTAPSDFMDLSSETPPPTTDRLIFIGEAIFELGAKDWLHDHFRKHANSSLKAKFARIFPRKAGSWGKLYKLPSRLAVATTGEQPMKLTAGDLFVAYLGALYLSQKDFIASSNTAIVWIKNILDYEQAEGSAESDKETLVAQHSQLQSPIKPPSVYHAANHAAPQSTLQRAVSPPGSTVNAVSALNEYAMKNGKVLNWADESTGQDHVKTWTVRVYLDGKEFSGEGHNKKQAKVAAAEVALKSMNSA